MAKDLLRQLCGACGFAACLFFTAQANQKCVSLQREFAAVSKLWPQYNLISRPVSEPCKARWKKLLVSVRNELSRLADEELPATAESDVISALDLACRVSTSIFDEVPLVYTKYLQPALKSSHDRTHGMDVNFDTWHFNTNILKQNADTIERGLDCVLTKMSDLRRMRDLLAAYRLLTAETQPSVVSIVYDVLDLVYEKVLSIKEDVLSIEKLA